MGSACALGYLILLVPIRMVPKTMQGVKCDVKLPQPPSRSAVEIGNERADRVDIELLTLDD